MNDDEKVTYFGETDARNKRVKFGIRAKDRSRHMYAIGKTGMGKSTLLENLAVQDIRDGNGLAFIDPHGKSADLLLEYIPKERINDVIYFAPFDMEYPVSFNVMEDVGAERRHLVSSGLMSAFKKIWVDAWSARMEYILNNIMLALLEYPGSTLLGVNRMLADKDFRKKVVDNITDPSVKAFWVDEYAKYTDKFAAEAAPAIQNKVGQFVTNPLIRNIIGQPKSTFDIRKIMDEKKILIINLSKGRVGESNANLLGSMLITKIYLAAMSRAEMNEKELKAAANFYLYVDEFQSFANESFADILSEARKYKLNLIIAHQYIEQMSDEVRAAVFGNVGTMCVFRVGAYDAEVLEKEFAPQFTAEDIVNLQQYQMYLKLMIDYVGSPPFSARGLGPAVKPEISYVKEIIAASRSTYSRPRSEIENDIVQWLQNSLEGAQISAAQAVARGGEYRYDGSYKGPAQVPRERSDRGEKSTENRNAPRRDDRPYSPQGGPQIQGSFKGSGGRGTPAQSPNKAPETRFDAQGIGSKPRGPRSEPVTERSSERAHQNAAREDQLRKAVSLSYLKSEPETKNDQKQAKPENVAALRDALLSVMKEAGAQMTPVSAQQPVQPSPVKTETVSQVTQSPAGQPIIQATTVNIEVPATSQTPEIKVTTQSNATRQQPVLPRTESPQIERKDKQQPSEVPEDVLKKMLEVE
ncbi:MAG: type IV secretion system DNA-binding domain-containing protein [Patescibacteria group bacterium]